VWIKESGKWSSSKTRNLRRGIVDYIEMCKLNQDDKGFDQEKFLEIKTNEGPNLTYHGMKLQRLEDYFLDRHTALEEVEPVRSRGSEVTLPFVREAWNTFHKRSL
jgi:hypothetical protein